MHDPARLMRARRLDAVLETLRRHAAERERERERKRRLRPPTPRGTQRT